MTLQTIKCLPIVIKRETVISFWILSGELIHPLIALLKGYFSYLIIFPHIKRRRLEKYYVDIIKYIYDKYEYRIKGHEIQQLHSNFRKMTLAERSSMISSFCTKYEIEYLTYHAPIFEHNIFDEMA
jgi:hypothetical protein